MNGKELGIPEKKITEAWKLLKLNNYLVSLLNIVCVSRGCYRGEAKGPHWVSYSITSHLNPLRHSLSLNLEQGWRPASLRDALVSALLA